MSKIIYDDQNKQSQTENLARILLEFKLTYSLGKKLSRTNLIKLKQQFKRIVKNDNNIPANLSSKSMSNIYSQKQ